MSSRHLRQSDKTRAGPTTTGDDRSDAIVIQLHDRLTRLARQLRNLELPDGMTHERLSALMTIDIYGPISVTALADRELVRPATMSRMVSALVHEGLARRQDDRRDGRGVLVTATARGRRAFRRANEYRTTLFREAIEGLNDDQLAAISTLTVILDRLGMLLDNRAG